MSDITTRVAGASRKRVSDILAVQSPDHHDVDLAPSRGLQQPLAARPLPRAGADGLPLSHEIPTTNLDVNDRRFDLKAERLLVVRGDAGFQTPTFKSIHP
jgi:hypothetical protein